MMKRAFPVHVANMWNDLPFHITSVQSLAVLRQCQDFVLFLLIIICYYCFILFSGIFCGPCNRPNWHYLGHVEHVDDDEQ